MNKIEINSKSKNLQEDGIPLNHSPKLKGRAVRPALAKTPYFSPEILKKSQEIWQAAIENDAAKVKTLLGNSVTALHPKTCGAAIAEAVINGNKEIFELLRDQEISANDRGEAIWKGALKEKMDSATMGILQALSTQPIPEFYRDQAISSANKKGHIELALMLEKAYPEV